MSRWTPDDLASYQARQGIVEAKPKRKRRDGDIGRFGNVFTEYNGTLYDSAHEADFAQRLDLEKKAGIVSYWLRQVPFALPGGVTYRVDFQVFYTDGTHRYFDPKGHQTKEFKTKLKQVQALYPVTIELV